MVEAAVQGVAEVGVTLAATAAVKPLNVTAVPAVSVAPYAVVRQTALSLPKSPIPADEFRARTERMLRLLTWSARVSIELSDTLHDVVAHAPPDLRAALLQLRRDVHNQRTPRPALRAKVADLSERIPLLRQWLDARNEIDRLGLDLDELAEPALRAERAVLAEVCGSEALQRAVALTSVDLLRAVQRTAQQGAEPDRRARKSEATVLRYALRAATKTNPLSWFAQVQWGWWREDADTSDRPGTGARDEVLAVAQADRAALTALVHAVLDRRDLREVLLYQLAPGTHTDGRQLLFHRRTVSGDVPAGLVREEEVALPLTKPLCEVMAAVSAHGPLPLRSLAASIAKRLPGPPQAAAQAADAYVGRLIDEGMLRPTYPIDPQNLDALAAVGCWLTDLNLVDLAALVREIDAQTARYAHLAAADRPAALARISSLWSEVLALAGAAPIARRTLVTEDITCSTSLPLGARHGREVLPDLTRLVPLMEIFDQHAVVRRLARDRFVARFGIGGTCDSLAVITDELGEIWQQLKFFEADGTVTAGDDASFDSKLHELARLRRELADAVEVTGDEFVLPEQMVLDAERILPRWLQARPTSYSVFAQPLANDAEGTRLCVNHIYGGWGRFTSRFLHYFGPDAAAAVSAQIAHGMGERGRVMQIRPVNGFNGNLHPLLVADEIATDGAWGKYLPEDLHLVHHPDTDQLRLRVAATGEFLDVLYLGFLVPVVLPPRLITLFTDHGSGLVDLTGALVRPQERDTELGTVQYRPRLRYRDVVLSRAQWQLSPAMVQAWRSELDREPGLPVRTALRWRHHVGLPQRVFVSAAVNTDADGLDGFMSYFQQARSQYVDLGSALHLRNLSRVLARYPHGVVFEEALPEPQVGIRAVEIVTELYRRTS